VVGQKLDEEIIIYSSKQLYILEENPNSISFDQSQTIKKKQEKRYLIDIIIKNWYTNIRKIKIYSNEWHSNSLNIPIPYLPSKKRQ
jgi:maltodextrin utilization protein YvdJ